MKNRKMYNRRMKMTAIMLMGIFLYQLVFPNIAMALTTGPSQPEVQAFEPVGTTDMVDMFSGSFVYNIPLLDVEGYPVNISYHGGVTMEQEASWVGLGWNINPGVVNRAVRGVPDDFNGDTVYKDFHIKPERTLRVGTDIGGELAGAGDPALDFKFSLGSNINISNYRGISADFSASGTMGFGPISLGVNMGVGTQTGASTDLQMTWATPKKISGEDAKYGLSATIGSGYNTRGGLRDLTISREVRTPNKYISDALSGQSEIPIGIKNYVPVITNSSTMSSINGRIKSGLEGFGAFGYGAINGTYSQLSYRNDASRATYGYMYLQNARLKDEDVLDFTRDKDGNFNKSMQYLPVPNMAYDIYNVSGQGTGGMFRPYRNDFGSVYDPFTTSATHSSSRQMEGGLGNAFESGLDGSETHTDISSGPWLDYHRKGVVKGFRKRTAGSIYEEVYFKQGGELTMIDSQYFLAIGGTPPISPVAAMNLPSIKPGSDTRRDPRGNLVHYHTASEADASGVAADRHILSNRDAGHTHPMDSSFMDVVNRVGKGPFKRKKSQISEIVQIQKDGRKYVYGIPAMNNLEREVSFTVDPTSPENSLNINTGQVSFSAMDASNENEKGIDNFYSSSVTPAYAHSYLLTSVLSSDYVDVTGDGVSDDDLGTFTKFKYCRTDSDFRWVTPYSAGLDLAQYNVGFWSDRRDDKANFVCGSREQWYLHAIETKNYIAEFYTSPRSDAGGIDAAVVNNWPGSIYSSTKSSGSVSYKLDSIKLYNKHDRYGNGAFAVPVKTIFFEYDYSLCRGLPNNSVIGDGKLTLKKIYFRYGNSQRSMTSPYQFTYGHNPDYDYSAKDRWGNYKPNNPAFTNWEFPYVDQNDGMLGTYASSWSLVEIWLPSGGIIKAEYESNDYAFVQDKPANEMFMVKGVGTSPNFSPGALLYSRVNSPCLFLYFPRRLTSELAGLTFVQNYFGRDFEPGGDNCMYFNFNVQLTNASDTYEQIKGYVNVVDAGVCSNDTTYGYIKLDPVSQAKDVVSQLAGMHSLNPITFTALNTARYNLPQIVFPGQDPDRSDMRNMLAGFFGAFEELVAIGLNPITRLLLRGGGKHVNLTKSFIRLHCPGMKKKGGGQRVRSLKFEDQWTALAGGNESNAVYGKEYSYTTNDPGYGQISSGVASYETLIGGDENPFRQPVKYTVQSGSKFPPNDPVDLYQETPIGESLFPSGQIGYSQVTITSMHQNEGRSSKTVDRHEFYTAKDFPVQVIATAINTESVNKFKLFSQKNYLTATQGYSLIFNDMHGKPKKVEHSKYNQATGGYIPVNYQAYNYKVKKGNLDNKVDCFVHDGTNMVVKKMRLGIEEDVTLDTREKKEFTITHSLNANLNFFFLPLVVPIPVPLPFIFPWEKKRETRFRSAVVTKVIQQYGIVDNIESYNEGAKTTVRNEIFDAITGQPVVTSVNNEFKDKEYTTNIPAWWVYKGMAGSYSNIGYKDVGTISVNSYHLGTLTVSNPTPLCPGDYLSVYFRDEAHHVRHTTAWVMGTIPEYTDGGDTICGGLKVLPHFPANTPGWTAGATLDSVTIRVISSGHKNLLEENVQTYSSINHPTSGGSTLASSLTGLIDVTAKTFSDSNTRTLTRYISNPDSVNPYAMGQRGEWRLLSEYAYHSDRNYGSATSRTAGLYNAPSLFAPSPGIEPGLCSIEPYNFLHFAATPNWRAIRTITKWSPSGKEVENKDAIGNYSTAVFGYNDELPIAVASNARQGEILSLGFEDFGLLHPLQGIMHHNNYHAVVGSAGSFLPPVYGMTACALEIDATTGHTGTNALLPTTIQGGTLPIPILDEDLGTGTNRYNNYFSSSPVSGYHFTPDNAYLGFAVRKGKSYIMNFWIKQDNMGPVNTLDYLPAASPEVRVNVGGAYTHNLATKKTNIIDGWQQLEIRFHVPLSVTAIDIVLPLSFYTDDIRIFPANANMKAFVYSPVNKALRAPNERLMATLDENNFATMYEYDAEGNLVRVKKETAKGIMTVSESRKGNPKKQ